MFINNLFIVLSQAMLRGPQELLVYLQTLRPMTSCEEKKHEMGL